MLSLISTLGGLLISGLPKLLEFFQNRPTSAMSWTWPGCKASVSWPWLHRALRPNSASKRFAPTRLRWRPMLG